MRHYFQESVLIGLLIAFHQDYDQRPTVRSVSDEWSRAVEVWLPLGQEKGKWAELESNALVSVHTLSVKQLQRCRLPRTLRDDSGVFEEPEMTGECSKAEHRHSYWSRSHGPLALLPERTGYGYPLGRTGGPRGTSSLVGALANAGIKPRREAASA